jgi:hypothetical protein
MMQITESIPGAIREQISNLKASTESVSGYNTLLIITAVFFILASFIAVYNPTGFDKTLGYGLFITLILIMIILFLLKRYISPESGAKVVQYVSFAQYVKETVSSLFTVFGKWETIGSIVIILALFFGLLGSFGLYTNNIPENNSAVLFNYVLILVVGLISYFLFNKARNRDDSAFQTLPNLKNPLSKLVYDDKIKYTLMFIFFLLSVLGLYLLNPYGIMSKYGGGVIFFMMFIGMSIFAMIKLNDYFFNNPNKLSEYQNSPGITSFLKVIYIFAALFVSGMLLYGFLAVLGVFSNNSGSTHSIRHIIVNLILLMSMLGILYKLINAGGFLERNPYFRLFINTVFYIPCLLVVVTDYLSNIFFGSKNSLDGLKVSDSFKTTKNDFAFLILSVIVCITYIFVTSTAIPFTKEQYYKVGGDVIVTTPIPIGKQTNLASYLSLNGTSNFNYTYAISFWFYIDSFPPSTNSSYSKSVSIMSYGDNLHVKYYSPTNTLYVTVKEDPANISDANITNVQTMEKTITLDNINDWTSIQSIQTTIADKIDKIRGLTIQPELDESNDRIIYKNTDVLLQKWNNIVLNYSSGTLDVFYNGELVKSAINVVPYKGTNDVLSVGTENGISGSVANLTFFKTPIDILTINKLYELFKEKNPPLASS